MTSVLVDVHLLEAKVLQLNLSTDSTTKVYSILEKQLFEKHNTDSLQYAESMKFYAREPELFHDIYEIVVDTLMIRERSKKID